MSGTLDSYSYIGGCFVVVNELDGTKVYVFASNIIILRLECTTCSLFIIVGIIVTILAKSYVFLFIFLLSMNMHMNLKKQAHSFVG